jgi:hypothetical protein
MILPGRGGTEMKGPNAHAHFQHPVEAKQLLRHRLGQGVAIEDWFL